MSSPLPVLKFLIASAGSPRRSLFTATPKESFFSAPRRHDYAPPPPPLPKALRNRRSSFYPFGSPLCIVIAPRVFAAALISSQVNPGHDCPFMAVFGDDDTLQGSLTPFHQRCPPLIRGMLLLDFYEKCGTLAHSAFAFFPSFSFAPLARRRLGFFSGEGLV